MNLHSAFVWLKALGSLNNHVAVGVGDLINSKHTSYVDDIFGSNYVSLYF
jgi:hypothetical protein